MFHRRDALEGRRQFEHLGRKIDSFTLGALSVDDAVSEEINTQNMFTAVKLLNSNLVMLKAKSHGEQIISGAPISDFQDSTRSLNEKIDLRLLTELTYKTSVGSSLIQRLDFEKSALTDMESVLVNIIVNRSKMNQELMKITKKLQESRSTVMEKRKDLLKELNSYDYALSLQRRELANKGVRQKDDSRKKQLSSLIEKANLTRTILVNILAASKINLQTNRRMVKLICDCRKPITLADL